MARGRILRKKISQDAKVKRLIDNAGMEAGLVWTWLIAHLDVDGRASGEPAVVKGIVCPLLDAITVADVDDILNAAHGVGLLERYEVDGEKYLYYPNFHKNQIGLRINREPESEYPAREKSRAARESSSDGIREEKRREEKRMKEKRREESALSEIEDTKDAKGIKTINLNCNEKPDERIGQIVEHYLLSMPKHRGQAQKPETRQLIRQRLDNHSLGDLLLAIDGCVSDEWHRSTGRISILRIFESDEKTDEYIQKATYKDPVERWVDGEED